MAVPFGVRGRERLRSELDKELLSFAGRLTRRRSFAHFPQPFAHCVTSLVDFCGDEDLRVDCDALEIRRQFPATHILGRNYAEPREAIATQILVQDEE